MIYGGIGTMILMFAIALAVALSVVLPWKKILSASMVLSASIIVILLLGFLLSSRIMRFTIGGEMLYIPPDMIWIDLGLYPMDIVTDFSFYRFITSMFIHGGVLHAVANLVGLLFIGYQFEQRIGWKRLLVLYYGTGILASCVMIAISPFDLLGQSMVTVGIGASAAIFGILGAFFYLYPNEEIVFPLIIIRKWKISLIIFIYLIITSVFIFTGTSDNVSHIAHFAGLGVSFPLAAIIGRPPVEGDKAMKILDLDKLEDLSRDPSASRALELARKADEPEIRDAWLAEYFKKSKCPECKGKGMLYEEGKAKCPRCDHRISL